jgi:hypothetical protein
MTPPLDALVFHIQRVIAFFQAITAKAVQGQLDVTTAQTLDKVTLLLGKHGPTDDQLLDDAVNQTEAEVLVEEERRKKKRVRGKRKKERKEKEKQRHVVEIKENGERENKKTIRKTSR